MAGGDSLDAQLAPPPAPGLVSFLRGSQEEWSNDWFSDMFSGPLWRPRGCDTDVQACGWGQKEALGRSGALHWGGPAHEWRAAPSAGQGDAYRPPVRHGATRGPAGLWLCP